MIVARGSSPRGRGKRRGGCSSPRPVWLIPAWAGKTRRVAVTRACAAAHPRVGGENKAVRDLRVTLVGSSPRGRGKHRLVQDLPPASRLIPAWAGKTSTTQTASPSGPAHPRVGGENHWAAVYAPVATGSSPRGRGKQVQFLESRAFDGLIPAWAGKTPSKPRVISQPGAHPRVGGENSCWESWPCGSSGSSPRGRGKLLPVLAAHLHARLIPAWAGKTQVESICGEPGWAHPRVGGENSA